MRRQREGVGVDWKPTVRVREQMLALASATNARCGRSSAARTLGQHSQLLRELWEVAVARPGGRTWFSLLVTNIPRTRSTSVLISVCPLLSGVYDVKTLSWDNDATPQTKLWVSPSHHLIPAVHESPFLRYFIEEAGSGVRRQIASHNLNFRLGSRFGYNGKWWVWYATNEDPTALVIRPILDPDDSRVTIISGFHSRTAQRSDVVDLVFNQSLPDEILVVTRAGINMDILSFHVIDVAKTHQMHCITSLFSAMDIQCTGYMQALLMRKRNGDVSIVVGCYDSSKRIVHMYEPSLSGVKELRTGKVTPHSSLLTLSQLSSSLFCISSMNPFEYEIWDCNCATHALWVGGSGSGWWNDFLALSGYIFHVNKKKIMMVEPLSGDIILQLTLNNNKKLMKIGTIQTLLSFS